MTYGKTWALIANGGRARIVKYLGNAEAEQILDLNDGQTKTGELMSDKAGRSFASMGKSRSGMELHSDPVRNQERLFAEQLSGFLCEKVKERQIDTLLVAASPRTLGDLRKAFPKSLQKLVIRETDKDLTQLADPELLGALQQLLHSDKQ